LGFSVPNSGFLLLLLQHCALEFPDPEDASYLLMPKRTVLPPMPLQKPIPPLKPGVKPSKRLAKPVAAKRGRGA
jgi:hypothetical protein